MSTQLSLPVDVTEREIARERTFGEAMLLCAKAGGYSLDKELQSDLGADKAQFSRWKSDQEGISWPKLKKLMDLCGNDAPVRWMLFQLGYDLASLRKRETETERENRLLREEVVALRRVLMAGDRA